MIDVGIIGAGFIGKTHAAGYKRIKDVRFADIAEANEEAGQALADDCGAEYCSSAEDLISQSSIYGCYLFGEVDKVFSIGKKSENGAWNFIVRNLIFRNGVRAAVECSYEMTENYPFSMNLRSTGKEGTAEFIFKAGFNLENRNDVISSLVLYKNGKDPVEIPASQSDAYAQEVANFIECVRNGCDPEVITMDDSRHTLAVILSIKESLETEEVVSV